MKFFSPLLILTSIIIASFAATADMTSDFQACEDAVVDVKVAIDVLSPTSTATDIEVWVTDTFENSLS
jgi:hypothetical protein